MFKVMRAYRDEYGTSRQRYVGNREYKTQRAAEIKADNNKGGFVIRAGAGAPVYVGAWQ